jgi:VanZ like protein
MPNTRARVVLVAVVAAILSVTLYPASGEPRPMLWCIACGSSSTADVMANIVLFLPFGAMLAVLQVQRRRAWLTGALFSSFIECAQLFVPGRDSSIGDVLANTAGTAAGFALAGWLLSQLASRDRTPRPSSLPYALGAAALVPVFVGATGFLLQPSFPADVTYFGQWTPDLGSMEWYRGRVLQAEIGVLPLPSAALSDTRAVRALLLAGTRLRVLAIAGRPVRHLAPIFSIYDGDEREMLLLGLDDRDLVLRYRTRAVAWNLDQPDIHLSGAARAVAPGDTLDLTMAGNEICLQFQGHRVCRRSFTPGRGWALLYYPESLSEWQRRLLDAIWFGGLLFLVGFWSRGDRAALLRAGALGLAALALVPPLVDLRAVSVPEWAGALAGLWLGAQAWATLQRWMRAGYLRVPSN